MNAGQDAFTPLYTPAGSDAHEVLLPLAGLNIAVTRPLDQARQLALSIAEAGGTVLLFPLLQISAAEDAASVQAQLSRLASFDLCIFISPNAVRYGMAAINAAGGLPPGISIATLGQGSAAALRELGVLRVIAPLGRSDSESLLALPELDKAARVLILRGDGGRELLGDTLRARGALVEYVACYRRSRTLADIAPLLFADALTVTSSEALEALWQLADCAQRERLARLPLFVQHPRIAELARQAGFLQVFLSGAGDGGLLAALTIWGGRMRDSGARGNGQAA